MYYVLAVLAIVLAPTVAHAVVITSGSIFNTRQSGVVDIAGEGFTLQAIELEGAGFTPGICGGPGCQPGGTLPLHTDWSGKDLKGAATVNGRVFSEVGSGPQADQARVSTDAGVLLPPFSDARPLDELGGQRGIILETPFTFEGHFSHSPERLFGDDQRFTLPLVGGGTATVRVRLIGPFPEFPSRWELENVTFAFAPDTFVPEPGTLLLVGAGLVALGVRRFRKSPGGCNT